MIYSYRLELKPDKISKRSPKFLISLEKSVGNKLHGQDNVFITVYNIHDWKEKIEIITTI